MKITMSDPYRVLGVTSSATDDEIREAYRNLAAKYHPDVQGQGPLSDIAETKMQELNEAYDRIMDITFVGIYSAESQRKFAFCRNQKTDSARKSFYCRRYARKDRYRKRCGMVFPERKRMLCERMA